MNHSLKLGSLLLTSLAIAACSNASASGDEPVDSNTQEMTSSWFGTHLPPGSADETGVLALVNDKSMSASEYVDKCMFSNAQASAIVDYRQGDEPADPSDDEVFDDVKELDRLPYTNSTFWVAAMACAKKYYAPTGPQPALTCGTGTSTVQQAALALEIVLDGSGSMTGDKWAAATAAVNEIIAAQAAKNDPKTGFGLIGFSDSKDPQGFATAPVYPTTIDVGVAPVDAAQLGLLQARLAGAQAGGGTPLFEAVTGAYGYLDTLALTGSLQDATKAVVLLTDGIPNDHAAELVTFVQANSTKAQLFAVGIGLPSTTNWDYDAAYMGSLAVAGGTRSSATCDPAALTDETKMCHFQVTPNAKPASQIRDELLAAVDKIRTNIAACDIGLQILPTGTLDPSKVSVVVEDAAGVKTAMPANGTNGWSLDNPTTPTKILVRGTYCDDLRADQTKRAKVEVGCK